MQYGLNKQELTRIRVVMASFPEVDKAILYGSRAKGNYKPASDIDLTFLGDRLTLTILNKIALQLDDLMLPCTFDLSIFRHITNPDLTDHIHRVGVVFYERQAGNFRGSYD
jgi:predicted nucleotidyltransferase